MTAFKTKFFFASAFNILVRNKLSFSAQVLASFLRTPSSVFVVIRVIPVMPKQVLIVIFVISCFIFLAFRKMREELKKHGKWNHHVTVSLLASCVNTLSAFFNLFF